MGQTVALAGERKLVGGLLQAGSVRGAGELSLVTGLDSEQLAQLLCESKNRRVGLSHWG